MDSSRSTLPEIAAFLRRGKQVRKIPVPALEALPPPLRDAAETLPGLTGTWNPVEIYTADPKVLRSEKQKFFAAFRRGIAYQPVLTYDYAESLRLGDARARLEALLERVRACQPEDRGSKLMRLMFVYKIKDDLATCDLVEGLQGKDERKVFKAFQYKYPGVDPLIQQMAEEDFNRRTSGTVGTDPGVPGELSDEERTYLRTTVFDAASIKEAFEWALAQYGILRTAEGGKGYRVIVDRRATAMDVRDKSALGPTVFIPETARETGERLLGLIAHEIEGHARQSWNGERLFMFGGGPLKIDEETLYEGLAMRYENEFRRRYFGSEYASRNMDYYVFAVHTAESGGSFYDVFADQMDKRLRVALGVPLHTSFSHTQVKDRELCEKVMEGAWMTAYRSMRGHLDMHNPLGFAMAKDLAYFRGYILDHQLRQHGHGFINELSICSIGQLRVLAELDIDERDVAAPYKDVTSDYLRMLLAKRGKTGGSFQVHRRL